jgi:hypothetical protein
MNTKIMIVTAVAALSLATTAFAGEGQRSDQFVTGTQVANSSGSPAETGNQQYPAANPALSFQSLGEPTLPENGQNGPVQTANGLPVGFENGTQAYEQAQSVDRWYAQQGDYRYAQIHGVARPHS